MLQNLREKFTGWVAITILAVIGVTFVFVGGANFTFTGNNYAAKVDDSEIGLNQFESAYQQEIQANPQLAALPESTRLQMRSQLLEQMIQQRVIDNYIVSAGYQVSDEYITSLVQRTPEFQVDGKFNIELYRDILARQGYEPADFESAQRVTLRRNQVQRAIRGSALMTPAEYRRYLNLATEQRIVTLATIGSEAVADEIDVSDEMVLAYYDDNPTMYQIPESADVDYIEVLRSDIAQGITVSEEQLADYYDVNKDRYEQDEQRQARHILVLFNDDEDAAEVKANDLLARINAGEAFEDLARDNSDDGLTSQLGGDLGLITDTTFPGDLGGAIFSMAEGALDGPIKSEFGYHIIRLDRIVTPGPLPLDQVRAELMNELQDRNAESQFQDLESNLSSALFDAPDIATLAQTVGLEVKSTTGFTRLGGEILGNDAATIEAIFDETVISGEQISDIVEIASGRSAVFFVTNHTPAARQPLADVREDVIDGLRLQQAEELMASKADAMLAALADGTEFADAAAAVGATANEPVLMSRDAEAADQFISVAVFTAVKPEEQDQPTTGSTRNGTG